MRIKLNDVDYYYEKQGSGSEVILFSHGLLWSGKMFEKQVEELAKEYTVITYDHRGQGRTEVVEEGYDMDTLTDDVVQLIEKLDLGPVHFVGLSMGGFVGMRLAARHPKLVKSLVLLETSAKPEPSENLFKYKLLGLVARWISIRLVAGRVMNIMFGESFLNDPNRKKEREFWKQELLNNDRVGIYLALKGVINRDGVSNELENITCPTLIMVGKEDIATKPEESEHMKELIPNAELKYIPRAGHTSSVEEPEFVTRQIKEFIGQ